MISLNSLKVRKGQRLNRAFFQTIWVRLLAAIEERTVKKGRGTVVVHRPDGTMVRAAGGGGTGGSAVVHPWQMSLEEVEANRWRVRFRQGFINGIEGKIGEERISEVDPKTEETPALEIGSADFGPDGVCRIYAKVEFGPGWYTKRVSLLASQEALGKGPYLYHKLIGLLVRDAGGEVAMEQAVFFNLSVTPVGQKGDRATYIPSVA